MASFGEIEPGLTSREEARRHDAADLYGLSGQDLDDFVGEHRAADTTCAPGSEGEAIESSLTAQESGSGSSQGRTALAGVEAEFPPNIIPGIN